MASDALLVDVSMLHIENGAMITAHCSVYAHFFDERFLLLGPVHIGKGANILEGTRIGPSTKIGAGALILDRVLLRSSAEHLRVSDSDILDGIAWSVA